MTMTHSTSSDPIPERVLLRAVYPAVPWACPESVELDLSCGTTLHAVQALIGSLARVPAAADVRYSTGPDLPMPRDES
jgi:hypothetical protein